MVKKITIGMMFLMLVSAGIYSQTVYSEGLGLLQEMSRETFLETGRVVNGSFEGYTRAERLPNSIVNEIDRQLTDYRPLKNGQVFAWVGRLYPGAAGYHHYLVSLRIIDARNSKWEYFASMKYISTRY
jgi:hypothetical protein